MIGVCELGKVFVGFASIFISLHIVYEFSVDKYLRLAAPAEAT